MLYNLAMNKQLRIFLIVVCVLAGAFLIWQIAIKINKSGEISIKNPNQNSSNNESISTPNQLDQGNDNISVAEKIIIDKISVSAPIVLNIDGNNKEEYMKALENGVAQMAKTALPGEAGNTVIFAHSSYYESRPGNYKTIFADLDKLAAGDIIQLSSGAKIVSYTVIEIKTVKPEDVSIVNQNKNEYKLTLVTCWPPKTTNERLVVVAKEIQ